MRGSRVAPQVRGLTVRCGGNGHPKAQRQKHGGAPEQQHVNDGFMGIQMHCLISFPLVFVTGMGEAIRTKHISPPNYLDQ